MRKWLTILLILASISGLVFFLTSDFWAIKKVNCRLSGQSCPTAIWSDLVSSTVGKNLLFLSSLKTEHLAVEKDNLIKNAKVTKVWPRTLNFELEKRNSQLAVVQQLSLLVEDLVEEEEEEAVEEIAADMEQSELLTTGDFFIVDEEGVILAKEPKTDLPLVLVNEVISFQIGDQFDKPEINRAIDILIALKLAVFEVDLARVVSAWSVEVWLKDGTQVEFSTQSDLIHQIASLQLINSASRIDGKHIKRIDLRFDKPVVIYD